MSSLEPEPVEPTDTDIDLQTDVAPVTDLEMPFESEMLEKIACEMADCYKNGSVSEDADFLEALLNNERVKGVCENIGHMPEDTVYEVAQMVKQKLEENPALAALGSAAASGGLSGNLSGNEVNINTEEQEVTPEQLQEALEILSSSLNEEELKDL
jgi:nicotinamide mononucleotide (NMN) deamidase PncC